MGLACNCWPGSILRSNPRSALPGSPGSYLVGCRTVRIRPAWQGRCCKGPEVGSLQHPSPGGTGQPRGDAEHGVAYGQSGPSVAARSAETFHIKLLALQVIQGYLLLTELRRSELQEDTLVTLFQYLDDLYIGAFSRGGLRYCGSRARSDPGMKMAMICERRRFGVFIGLLSINV